VVACLAFFFVSIVGAAGGTSAGAAQITDSGNGTTAGTGKPLGSGGSTTQWSIKLPDGAACSKDTQTNSYHVQGYLMLASAYPDPGAVTYNNGPVQDAAHDPAYPLFYQSGTLQYSDQATGSAAANGTAPVVNIPTTFDYSLFTIDGHGSTGKLPAGTYNVGIACTLPPTGAGQAAVVDKFWNTQVIFAASSSDPAGETWTAPGSQPTTTTTTPPASTTSTTGATSTTATTSPSSTTSTTSGNTSSSTSTPTPAAASAPAGSDSSGSPSTLASTGGPNLGAMLFLASALLLVGFVLVLMARRHRTTPAELRQPSRRNEGPEDTR
jgi:hypothetical protein